MEVYSSSYRLGAGLVTVTQGALESDRLGAGLVTVTLGALEELGAGWRWRCSPVR